MTNKTFLVLGSNSFSGSNLIYKLLHDHPSNRVIGVSRSKENKSYFLKYKKSVNLRNILLYMEILYIKKFINLITRIFI